MADYTGVIYHGILILTPTGDLLTTELSRHPGTAFDAYIQPVRDNHADGISEGNALLSDEPQLTLGGTFHEAGGQELFDKIVLTPRSVALGFVLADVTFTVNVWNTHRVDLQVCIRMDFEDSGNVFVDNPMGWPLKWGPLQARDFSVLVPRDGDAVINARAIFVFPGEAGTDLIVTGSRIIVLAVDADWSEPLRERIQYLTDILVAHSGKEQRMALRSTPRTHFSYRALTVSRLESAALEALLWGWQARIFGVPFWPDAQVLTQTVDAGDTVIIVDTATRKYAAGGLAVLYRSILESEAVTILSVSAHSITTTAPVNGTWPADGHTWIVPMMVGRLSTETRLNRHNNQITGADIVVDCEGC